MTKNCTVSLAEYASNRKPDRRTRRAHKATRNRLFDVSEALRKLAHEANQVHRELLNAKQANKGNTLVLVELDKLDAEAVTETARKAHELLKGYAA